jgi:hypothetical protein
VAFLLSKQNDIAVDMLGKVPIKIFAHLVFFGYTVSIIKSITRKTNDA